MFRGKAMNITPITYVVITTIILFGVTIRRS